MKRAIPVLALSAAALIPVWRYEPSTGTTTTAEAAESASTPSVSAGTPGGSTVVKGTTVTTEKGPVQVQVTFRGEKITAVKMLQQPHHPQTTAAVPKLVAETLEAQSADIDTVSGATITSDGYKKSLQAAIDASAEAAAATPSSSASRSVAGPTMNTEKGPVQVQVTFQGEKITAVRMLQQPHHPQTTAAVPKLVAETLEAQSADIDTVSGATITSDGYKKSLQAALDAKGA